MLYLYWLPSFGETAPIENAKAQYFACPWPQYFKSLLLQIV